MRSLSTQSLGNHACVIHLAKLWFLFDLRVLATVVHKLSGHLNLVRILNEVHMSCSIYYNSPPCPAILAEGYISSESQTSADMADTNFKCATLHRQIGRSAELPEPP